MDLPRRSFHVRSASLAIQRANLGVIMSRFSS
jgi:hypothetical protein